MDRHSREAAGGLSQVSRARSGSALDDLAERGLARHYSPGKGARPGALDEQPPSPKPPPLALDEIFEFEAAGLTEAKAEEARLEHGPNKLPSSEVPVWRQVLGLLTQPMALMMWIAAAIELLIENYPDCAILLGIILVNASISFYEMRKSGNAVAALQGSIKPKATVKRPGIGWLVVDAEELVPGDTVLLAAGSAVPADCRIHKGIITVDQAALTGESMPVKINGHDDPAQNPLMGTTVMTGEVEATVQKTGPKTVLGQTAALLDRPPEKSNLDKVLFKIVLVMAGLSVCLSMVVFVFGIYKGEGFKEVLSFTVVLIIASIPMAVEIVTTTTLALGARTLAEEGAIVTRLSSVEDMADATRETTIKYAAMAAKWKEVQTTFKSTILQQKIKIIPLKKLLMFLVDQPARDALDTLVLSTATEMGLLDELDGWAAQWSKHTPNGKGRGGREAAAIQLIVKSTNDAAAVGTLKGKLAALNIDALKEHARAAGVQDSALHDLDDIGFEEYQQTDFMPFDPAVKRTQATIKTKDNTVFKVMNDMAERGIRCLAVARQLPADSGVWKLEAMLTFMDPPRVDSKHTIDKAAEMGVPVRMITGDHLLIAKETCRQLGLQSNILGPYDLPLLDEDGNAPPAYDEVDHIRTDIGKLIAGADGFAQVYPQHKFIIVDVLRQLGYRVGMTGDGVNDAAAMKVADVGVCVEGGTDAARAAADIILTRPGLSIIVLAMEMARKIFARINNFMCYRLAASMQLLLYFFIAVLTIHPSEYIGGGGGEDHSGDGPGEDGDGWPYMYGMPVLLLMMITLLNDGALITIGYDHVEGSTRPTVWNIKMLFLVSFVMAAVACLSSLLLLHLALDSWREGSVFNDIGLENMSFGHITTLMYLKVSVSDFLTLFSCRAGDNYWWQSRPAPIVGAAAAIALSMSTAIACFYPTGTLDKMAVAGLLSAPAEAAAGAFLGVDALPQSNAFAPLFVWLYCIVWWWVQDGCKVLTYHICYERNVFGYRYAGHHKGGESGGSDGYHQLADSSSMSMSIGLVGLEGDTAPLLKGKSPPQGLKALV